MSKEFQKSFYDASPLGFASLEIIKTKKKSENEFHFQRVNAAFEKFTKRKMKNIIGKSFQDVFSDGEGKDWRGLFERAAETGCKDFEYYIESISKCFLVNVFKSDKTHLDVTLTDVTALKEPKDCGGLKSLKQNVFWDNNLFGVIIADKNGNYVDANEEACRMTGYSCDELKGMNVFGLIPIDDVKSAELHFESLVKDERAYGETAYYTKSGEKRWWNIVATKISDGLFLGLHEDITGRKLAEEKLREEEVHHANVIANIVDVLWEYELDSKGVFVRSYISPAVDGVIGLPTGSIGNDFEKYFRFIHSDDLQGVRDALVRYMFSDEKKVYTHEFRLKTIDGSIKYMRSTGIMHIKPNGNRLAYGTTTDLTERVKSDKEKVYLNELLKFVIENTKSSISVHDTEMNYIYVSNRYYDDMRLKDRNIIGKNHYEIFPHLPEFLHDVHKRALSGEIITGENDKLVHADGRVDWANWKSMPWYKADGTIGGIINYIEVITERKQAEEKLAKNQAELQAVYDNAPVMICVLDENRNVLYANPAFTSFSTVPEEELRAGKACGVFGCVNSKENTFGCGFGKNCNDCSLLIAVKDTLITGKEHKDIERTLKIEREGAQQEITLLGSTALIRFGKTNNIMLCLTDITKRKNAEQELQTSRKKFEELSTLMRLMTDNMQDMLWAKNLNKEFIFVNKSICENLLNAKDTIEPIGKTDMFFAQRERNSKPDNQEWHNFGEICVDSDTITLKEMKPMQFDEFGNVKGKFLFLDVHKAPLFDDNNQLIGVVGSARDVTAAKQTEIQLRKLSQAVEQSSASVVITDLEGKIEYVNPKFTELTGYTNVEAIGKNPNVLKSGVQTEEVYKELWKTITTGKEWKGEFHNKKKNGELYWESALISPIKNDKGEITHYLALKEDITERKELEANLKHQTMFRELLMDISSGFINIPIDKVNDSVNDALGKMALFVNADRAYTFDYDWENDFCNNIYEWCAEGISAEIHNLQHVPLSMMKDWVEAHKKGEPMFVSDVFSLPKGAVRDILEPQGIKSVLTVPMMIDNQCIGFVGFDSVLNHHEYTNTELQLLKVYAQLMANIKIRKVIVEQLMDAKLKAEESDRLKSSFLANMSHEIRTPMNGILGFADLLKTPNLEGSELQSYIAIIEKSGRRMLNIINDIIDISKIESGLMELRLSKSNIIEQIEYVYRFFKPEAESKGLKLLINNSIKGTDLFITTDREKLYAILTNLVKNAIKYTENGEIEFGCNCKEGLIEFFVKDTGIGIPESRHNAIFERFIQADIEDKMAYQGAGLGLSITKAYVEMMGGKIWVESKEGFGSVFNFTLPIDATNGSEMILNKSSNDADSKNDISKLKILIVEDDKVSEMLLEKNIKSIAKIILKASTGVEAVNLMRNNPDTDLILMDIRLPVLNGFEATRQIRQFNKSVIIIAQTAYGLVGDKEKVLEAGCDDYVAKPISLKELNIKIGKYF